MFIGPVLSVLSDAGVVAGLLAGFVGVVASIWGLRNELAYRRLAADRADLRAILDDAGRALDDLFRTAREYPVANHAVPPQVTAAAGLLAVRLGRRHRIVHQFVASIEAASIDDAESRQGALSRLRGTSSTRHRDGRRDSRNGSLEAVGTRRKPLNGCSPSSPIRVGRR